MLHADPSLRMSTIPSAADSTPLPTTAGALRAARRAPWWLLGLGLAACALYLSAVWWLLGRRLGFPLDDSWIHLQFARNLAQGHGLSYNPGELVTGSTAPLWTALLSLLFLLPGNVVLWTLLLGIVLHLAGIDAVWRLARALGLGRPGAALAAGLYLSTGWIVWSALSGMEIPLFILLSTWGMLRHLREREAQDAVTLAPALFAIAALARPEGLLLLALAFADRLLAVTADGTGARWRPPSWRALATGLLLAACALAGPLTFYRWAGGSFLPTTFAAKGAAGPHGPGPNLQYLYTVFGIFFSCQPWMTLAAAAGALRLVERLGSPRDRGLLPALWLGGLPLAYSCITPAPNRLLGNFGRYYFPLFPVLVVLGVCGLQRAAGALDALVKRRGPRRALAALGVALLLTPTVVQLFTGAQHYARNVANVEDSDVRIASWLGARLAPEALLAVNDIGAIKYFLPNRIVDLASIATPEIGREVARDMENGVPRDRAMLAAIERRRPDYLAVFPRWVPGLDRDPRFQAVYRLPIPDNHTMGDDQIVVYATPWTRYPLRPPD
jgi:hypothetical protein